MEGKRCDVIPYYQRYKNTCWKAVAKTVLQYMGYDVSEYRDTREREEDGPDSAIDLLFRATKRTNPRDFGQDNRTVPFIDEIIQEISKGRMMIGLVSTDINHGGIAHWILISGYVVEEGKNYIQIMDPEPEINHRSPFWLCYDNITRVEDGKDKHYYTVPGQEGFEQRYFKSVSYTPKDRRGAVSVVTEDEWEKATIIY